MEILTYEISTPLGPLYAGIRNNELVKLTFIKEKNTKSGEPSILKELKKEIDSYFRGELKEFKTPFVLEESGFTRKVLEELSKVEYGTTVSYSELAKRAGNEKACRAVGSCCHKNPICLIIPCHRVIKKDGRIGEFGGGSELKRKLLELEGIKITDGKRRT